MDGESSIPYLTMTMIDPLRALNGCPRLVRRNLLEDFYSITNIPIASLPQTGRTNRSWTEPSDTSLMIATDFRTNVPAYRTLSSFCVSDADPVDSSKPIFQIGLVESPNGGCGRCCLYRDHSHNKKNRCICRRNPP